MFSLQDYFNIHIFRVVISLICAHGYHLGENVNLNCPNVPTN